MARPHLLLVLSLLLIATACGGAATPVPTATTSPPTTTAAAPTTAPSPTATTAPSPTPRPAPTATPAPSPTPQARSPLTGMTVADEALTHRQPLAVQIDNAPDARPQTGLAAASVVIETPTEAGLTRFTALFLDHEAPVVGPVRSARLVDEEIIPQYQALLVSAGAANEVLDRIYGAGLPYVNLNTDTGAAGSWRSAERLAPYNLYTSTETLRQNAATLGIEQPTSLTADGLFGPLPDLPAAASAPAGKSVDIAYPYGEVRFAFDEASGGYQRYMAGEPHRDTADNVWIAPRNVVVQVAEFTTTDIVEDMFGSLSLEVALRGEGKVYILREGKLFEGTWHREKLTDRTTYRDAEGRPLTLAPGQTWIALVPPDMAVNIGS